jgi:ubiquinone biosynthesis protein
LRNLGRSREIATVLLNHGFGDLVDQLRLKRYLQWGRRLFLRKPVELPRRSRAERIRMALEDLGATFIKFGQVMSTRPDLIPADVICELSKLQENVPPFDSETAMRMIERELGAPVTSLFADFEPEPIAAGSLAQVHRALHHDGTPLAVKIRRPSVVGTVERDLALMSELAVLIVRHVPESEVFDPIGLVQHFSRTIRRELNFAREGRSIAEFARLFRNDATLHVPAVYWDLTTEGVLTMEFVEGCRVTDREAMCQRHIDPRDIATNGAHIFMKMAFEFGVFHGDPHPGNIRIGADGAICLLDYGMVGVLEDEKREQLVDLFLSITRQDVRTAVNLIHTLGQPYRPLDIPLVRADVRDFIENYYGLPLERLNVGKALTDFVSILLNHGIRCPADLMLLIRVFVTLEGVGRELDPQFNLATQLAPHVERIVRERYNPRRLTIRLLEESQNLLSIAHSLPRHLGTTFEKLSKNELRVQMEHSGMDHLITEIDRSSNRVVIGLVLSSLIVASALIIRSGAEILWFSVPTFLLSSLLGAWLIYGVFRSGRL